MSHFKEREEKVCLNCSAELNGKYCHQCGQENREPKSTAWGLVTHFFYDITHFDGKFFSTTGLLLKRPGYLPKEYINGRRARYLDPIRMYIFTSAFFFLIFFATYHVGDLGGDESAIKQQTSQALAAARTEILRQSATAEDSMVAENLFARVEQKRETDSIRSKDSIVARNAARDSTRVKTKNNTGMGWNFDLSKLPFDTREAYDSAQKTLPPGERDGWFERKLTYRSLEVNKKMKQDRNQLGKDLINKFVHMFPYMLFVSLPLYALWLKLLYIRRKKFYYVDHGIFLIYLYIFTFIFLLLMIGIDELQDATKWEWLDWLFIGMFFWGLYYAWRAMHKFYGQGRFKTFLKFTLFNLLCLVSIVLLFGVFFIFALFSI